MNSGSCPGIKDNGKWKTVPNSKELRLLWESALHICLETAVLKVTGDVKYPLETWPDNFQAELQNRIKLGQAVKREKCPTGTYLER